MKKVFIALADGFEESELVLPLDILRRAQVCVVLMSVSDSLTVVGAHGLSVVADTKISEAQILEGDMLFLPGGMPGAQNLLDHTLLADVIRSYFAAGKYLVAICAAPMVFGEMHLLSGRKATCYPGFESRLYGAAVETERVVVDGQFITACGPGAAPALGAKMVEVLLGEDSARIIMQQMLFEPSQIQ